MNAANHHVFHPDHADGYARLMHQGVDHLTAALRGRHRPATGLQPAEARARVEAVDLDEPLGDVDATLAELTEVYLDDAIWFHDPAYAAHLNCPVVMPALLAELFVSGVNSSLDTFDQSVGGTFIERRLVEWTARRLGLGSSADGIFTSGGTQSNLQALLMARGQHGATDTARLRILASADSHFSVIKAARLMGLAPHAVIAVPTDAEHRMDVTALAAALADCTDAGDVPMAVVATAGTTDFGAIDPLRAIAGLARSYDAWLHVDAAYGGGLITSARHRPLLDGIELADSVTIDYHKTFFQPVSASAVIVREASTMSAVTHHADYLNPRSAQQPNQVDKSIQTTRRFDALKLWITLRLMGADAIGSYLDSVIDLAATVGETLDHDREIEVAAQPSLSTVVFRYRPAGMSEAEADELNPLLRRELYASGAGMVAGTVVDGHVWLKLTLLNPMATERDILGVVQRVRAIAHDLTTTALAEVG